MNKKEMISRIAEVLRTNNIKKPVTLPQHKFFISDDEGNTKTFTVKKSDRNIAFTNDDISNIIDTFIYVLKDSISKGEPVYIYGLGTFSLGYRNPQKVKTIKGDDYVVEGRYVPKFKCGKHLKNSAKLYENSLSDRFRDLETLDEDDEYGISESDDICDLEDDLDEEDDE